VAAALAAMSALAAWAARADDPIGLSWSALELQSAALKARLDGKMQVVPFMSAADHGASAGASMLSPGGWRASLFVTYFGSSYAPNDDVLRLKPSSFVSARLSHLVAKDTRLTMEAFNVFDQRSAGADPLILSRPWNAFGLNESYLTDPAEPRSFRIRLGWSF
jgi:hypothetical protein